MGVHDFWDPEYWTPQGYAKRKQEERDGAKKLAIQQTQSNAAPWEAIGKGIGDAAGWIGETVSNPRNWGGQGNAQRAGDFLRAITPASRMPQRANVSGGDDISAQEFGDARQTNLDWGYPQKESETDRILNRLGSKFSFDKGTVDSTALDAMLKQNTDVLDGLRTQTNDNFQTSDRNIQSMHDAFRNDQMAQAPRLQAEGDAARADVEGIFGKTIDAAGQRRDKYNADSAEMFARLGIAPAAAQTDEFGKEVEQGIQDSEKARDMRTSEIASGTATNLNRNSQMATAIGNDGNARRSQLNLRLQEVLGNIDGKEADFQNDYQRQKMELGNNAEDQAYQRWIQDRQFDMGLFDSINQNNQAMAKSQATAAQAGAQGIDGLMGQTSPKMRAAFADISSKVNVAREPEKAVKLLQDPKYGLTPEEVSIWVTKYANLGTTNKFATE